MAVSVAVVTAVSVATPGRHESWGPPQPVTPVGEMPDSFCRPEPRGFGQHAGGQHPGIPIELGAHRHPKAGQVDQIALGQRRERVAQQPRIIGRGLQYLTPPLVDCQ
jgi:hypothetical protein